MRNPVKPKQGRQSKLFCFTDYDVSEERRYLYLKHPELAYTFFSEEKCPTTNKHHLQGFIYFKEEKRLTQVIKLFPITHWTQCTGTVDQNINYCSKSMSHVDGPWTSGDKPKQGERRDLQAIAEMVVNGSDMITIAREEPEAFVRYAVGLQRLALHFQVKRNWAMDIRIYHGSTGTGKTRRAFEENPKAYWKTKGDWWDAYDQEECVIWDEFAHDVPIACLLKICDRYPLMLQIKGGFVNFGSKRIILTSNIPFDEWYPDARQSHRDALKRRVTEVIDFDEIQNMQIE